MTSIKVPVGFGSGAKETLSMKQAERIIDESNAAITLCKTKMENRNDDFVEKISKIWEDQNAVEFMGKHKQNFEAILSELSKNQDIFVRTTQDIANAYASAGGIAKRLSKGQKALVGVFNISKVLDHFTDGEGDEFGFKDVKNGPAQVIDAFTELQKDLAKVSQETVQNIQSINAFGNSQVQLNLAQSSGKVVSIVEDNIKKSREQIKDYVEKTASSYKNVGSSAESASNISSSAE